MPNATAKSGRRATIQSVERAARILKVLASGPRRLGVSEIADRLGLTRPTVHGLLQTLQAQGFVEQDRDSDKYQLGAGLLQLGTSYLDLNELRGRSLGVVLSGGRAVWVSGPGAAWRTLPRLPAKASPAPDGGATLAAAPRGGFEALTARGGQMSVWSLSSGASGWSRSQVINVTIPYGSSG